MLKHIGVCCWVVGVLGACAPTEQLPSSAAQIESVGILAVQAHKQSAIDQLLRWAERGHPVAQRELALVYAKYPDMENPKTSAAAWLQKAALAGDLEAQLALAQAFHGGTLGLKLDDAQAWTWFEAAAQQGDGRASFMLARMASHGQGTPQSLERSVHWLQVAAQQKNA